MRRLLDRGPAARLLAIALVAVALAACSGSSAGTVAPEAPAAQGDGTLNGLDRSASGGEAFSAASAAPSAAATAAPAARPGDATTAAIDQGLQVVYTGSMQLVVADVGQALAKAKAAVEGVGGYIGASQQATSGEQPTATITYRIPATKWEATITSLEGVAAKVVEEQTQASEVGGQLVDLEARIANLRASEAALQDIAKSTAKVSDLLEVQAQLTDVRGQIEQLDAQRARLADQVAYGTMVATFGLEAQQVKAAAKGWDPATDVDGATAALLGVGQRIVSGLIWFGIVWLPFLVVALVVLFAAWRLLRRYGPKPSVPVEPITGWTGGGPKPEA